MEITPQSASRSISLMQMNSYENGVCPEWMRVERIASAKGGDGAGGEGTKYLVKWEVLSYQECTWESAEDLAGEEVRHELLSAQFWTHKLPKNTSHFFVSFAATYGPTMDMATETTLSNC